MLFEGAREAVRRIVLALPESRQPSLLRDLAQAELEDRNGIGSILGFRFRGYEVLHPCAQLLPVEGTVEDADGAALQVMLWLDANDRLYELELVRYDPGNLKGPSWSTFQLAT